MRRHKLYRGEKERILQVNSFIDEAGRHYDKCFCRAEQYSAEAEALAKFIVLHKMLFHNEKDFEIWKQYYEELEQVYAKAEAKEPMLVRLEMQKRKFRRQYRRLFRKFITSKDAAERSSILTGMEVLAAELLEDCLHAREEMEYCYRLFREFRRELNQVLFN